MIRCSMIWICSKGLTSAVDVRELPGICCGSASMLAEDW